jgi:hypothetical protein
MRRTLRHDGVVAQVGGADGIAAIAEWVGRELATDRRPQERPFEIVAQGTTPPDTERAAAIVQPFVEAGATWWIDADWGATVASIRARIEAGPPPVSGAGIAG